MAEQKQATKPNDTIEIPKKFAQRQPMATLGDLPLLQQLRARLSSSETTSESKLEA